jgi:hypothetical protein
MYIFIYRRAVEAITHLYIHIPSDKGIKTKASLFSPPKIRSDASFNQSEEAVDLLMNAGPSHECIFLIDFILYLYRSGWSVLVRR